MIRLENVTKKYKKKAVLQRVSFHIHRGEAIGIFGPNGAGKSTFLKTVASVIRPDEGSLYFHERPYESEIQSLRNAVGYVPQEIALYEDLTVGEQIAFWENVRRCSVSADYKDELIRVLGLREVWKQRVSRLSGGWKRKVSLCAGVLHEPSVILLDEPTAGVDLAAKEEILAWLNQRRKEGSTIVFISHDWHELRRLSDRYALFHRGEIWFEGDQHALQSFRENVIRQHPEEKELQNILRHCR